MNFIALLTSHISRAMISRVIRFVGESMLINEGYKYISKVVDPIIISKADQEMHAIAEMKTRLVNDQRKDLKKLLNERKEH